jgi:hypothetical protein
MRRERRKDFRIEWNLLATIGDAERHLARPCILSNFSNADAEITGVRARTIPDEFILQITPRDSRKCRVVWRTEDSLRVEFTDRQTSENFPNFELRIHGP